MIFSFSMLSLFGARGVFSSAPNALKAAFAAFVGRPSDQAQCGAGRGGRRRLAATKIGFLALNIPFPTTTLH